MGRQKVPPDAHRMMYRSFFQKRFGESLQGHDVSMYVYIHI